MIRKLFSLALAAAVALCPLSRLSYAAPSVETARLIAELFAEQEERIQQKLSLESGKRTSLEKENKELHQELEKLKNNRNKAKTPSVWSSIKTRFKRTTSLIFGVTGAVVAVFGVGAGVAGLCSVGTAVYDCRNDEKCGSFTEKMTMSRFFDSFELVTQFLSEVTKHIHIQDVDFNLNVNKDGG